VTKLMMIKKLVMRMFIVDKESVWQVQYFCGSYTICGNGHSEAMIRIIYTTKSVYIQNWGSQRTKLTTVMQKS
jgi:hypothetical protein